MNKEWFVFKGTHHLGPFSLEEMVAMFHAKEIMSQTLIWREGALKWDAFSRVEDFSFLFAPVKKPPLSVLPPLPKPEEPAEVEFDLPPPLPKALVLPTTHPLKEEVIEQVKPKQEDLEEDLPPPIPLEAILSTARSSTRRPLESSKAPFQLKSWILGFAAIVFVAVLVWFRSTQEQADVHIHIRGLMPVYLDKLEAIASARDGEPQLAMALSLDGKILWATTNIESSMVSVITLKSISKRVLGNEDVEVSLKGEFKDHVGKFNRMILIKGSKFLPGEYSYSVSVKETHFINRKFKKLASISFFRSLNKTHDFKGSTLIYSGTPREFEKRINDYSATLMAEQLRPFQEKLERIQTLESLLNATSQNFLMTLEHAKAGSYMKVFEKKFIKEISPVLQSLVLKSLEQSKEFKENENSAPGAIAPFKDQVLLGKQVGEMASEMITKTSKYKNFTASDKIQLKNEFERKSKAIKLQIDLNLKKLDEQIRKINKP